MGQLRRLGIVLTLRRRAARVVLLDREDRVLLLQAHDPTNAAKGTWWEIPGGGIEGGETTAAAARRELYEETGIAEIEMGPCVWRHHAVFDFAGFHFDQQEWVHVARSDGGDYRPAGLESIEVAAFEGARWWPLEDLEAFDGDGGPRVIPEWLPAQVPVLRAALETAGGDGPGTWPPEPIDMGELLPLGETGGTCA